MSRDSFQVCRFKEYGFCVNPNSCEFAWNSNHEFNSNELFMIAKLNFKQTKY